MKLSSWFCAAAVSSVLMERMAVVPVLMPSDLSPGTIVAFTSAWLAVSPSAATVLPLSVSYFLSSVSSTLVPASGVAETVSISPGVALSMTACVSSCVIRIEWCWFVKHSCAAPVAS